MSYQKKFVVDDEAVDELLRSHFSDEAIDGNILKSKFDGAEYVCFGFNSGAVARIPMNLVRLFPVNQRAYLVYVERPPYAKKTQGWEISKWDGKQWDIDPRKGTVIDFVALPEIADESPF